MNKCPQLKILGCSHNELTSLDLINCGKLEELSCGENQLTQIIFSSQLPNLEELICWDNLLTDLDWVALSGGKITVLSLSGNNFTSQNLSFLAEFTNLKELGLGNVNPVKIQQGIYNR